MVWERGNVTGHTHCHMCPDRIICSSINISDSGYRNALCNIGWTDQRFTDMCCVFSLLMTSQSAPSAWPRSTETKVTWRRRKRNRTKVRKETRAVNHRVCYYTYWTLVLFTVNGNAEQVDFIDSSVTEEEDDIRTNTSTPPSVPVIHTPISSCHAVSCPVYLLIMLTAYWFFRIRRTDRHRCNPRSQQHPGQWCAAQSELCMAVSPAVGSNLRAEGLLCNTTNTNLNSSSRLKEECWLSAQV